MPHRTKWAQLCPAVRRGGRRPASTPRQSRRLFRWTGWPLSGPYGASSSATASASARTSATKFGPPSWERRRGSERQDQDRARAGSPAVGGTDRAREARQPRIAPAGWPSRSLAWRTDPGRGRHHARSDLSEERPESDDWSGTDSPKSALAGDRHDSYQAELVRPAPAARIGRVDHRSSAPSGLPAPQRDESGSEPRVPREVRARLCAALEPTVTSRLACKSLLAN
jgi:hypothetical protein